MPTAGLSADGKQSLPVVVLNWTPLFNSHTNYIYHNKLGVLFITGFFSKVVGSADALSDVLNVGKQRVLLNGKLIPGQQAFHQVLVECLNLRKEKVEHHLQLPHVHSCQDAPVESP